MNECGVEKLLINGKFHEVAILDLSGRGLQCLPDGLVGSFSKLKVLIAGGNKFTSLPQNFGCLQQLEDLDLQKNQLKFLPDSMQFLGTLKTVNLVGNHLSALPDDFGEMTMLEELHVQENKLKNLPPTFALMCKLRVLDLSYNVLSYLPKHFGQLHILTHLNLCNNRLNDLPDSFYSLKCLECLDISSNCIEYLGKPACAFKGSLKRLYAGMNPLTSFPQFLCEMPELICLCLKETNLQGDYLPIDFGKVYKKLHYFNIRGSQLSKLPDSFGQQDLLEYVHLGCGSKWPEPDRVNFVANHLTMLPKNVCNLSQLTDLQLDKNNLQCLPDGFGRLPSLQYLNLCQNMLDDLPESFSELLNLQVCILSVNQLTLLPSNFGLLTSLEELYLDNNRLGELPDSFKELRQLRVLDLFANQLREIPPFLKSFTQLKYLDLEEAMTGNSDVYRGRTTADEEANVADIMCGGPGDFLCSTPFAVDSKHDEFPFRSMHSGCNVRPVVKHSRRFSVSSCIHCSDADSVSTGDRDAVDRQGSEPDLTASELDDDDVESRWSTPNLSSPSLWFEDNWGNDVESSVPTHDSLVDSELCFPFGTPHVILGMSFIS